jgi:hypothetical protein
MGFARGSTHPTRSAKKNLTRRANHRYIVILARGEPAVGKLAAGILFAGLSIGEFFASGVLAPFPLSRCSSAARLRQPPDRPNATGKLNDIFENTGAIDRAPIFARATGEQKS